jgi:dihydrofolate reductase
MSKVVVSTFLTLDGVMEDPGGGEGFQHGGWQLPFFDQDLAAGVREELFAAGALLPGRATYQHFAAAWPSITDDDGFADRMNSLPKFVASTTLQAPLAWNATLLKGDVAEAVAELKREPDQNILVQGSGELAQTLTRHSLIDEYRLWVHPVVVGSGRRLFRDESPRAHCDWSTPRRPAPASSTSPTGQRHRRRTGRPAASTRHHRCLGRPPLRAPQCLLARPADGAAADTLRVIIAECKAWRTAAPFRQVLSLPAALEPPMRSRSTGERRSRASQDRTSRLSHR